MKPSNTRINTLQAYRGIAAIMVVLFHITVLFKNASTRISSAKFFVRLRGC
jgi:peptidoglycan/LPS O-acetylase OafA/YrhL